MDDLTYRTVLSTGIAEPPAPETKWVHVFRLLAATPYLAILANRTPQLRGFAASALRQYVTCAACAARADALSPARVMGTVRDGNTPSCAFLNLKVDFTSYQECLMKIPPPERTASSPKQVRCPACELMQYEREQCRRCKRALPHPEVVFGPMTPVRTLDELERLAIEDALNKSASVSDAARRLGIGRTTLYGKLRRYELCSGPSREMPVDRSSRLKFRTMYQHRAGNGP